MRTDVVEIVARMREERERAIAVWDGTTCTDAGREIWTWLPKSQIRFERSGRDVVVRLPEWLVRRKALEDQVTDLHVRLELAGRRIKRLETRIDELERRLGERRPRS